MVQNYISRLMADFPISCKTLYLNLTFHYNVPTLYNMNFYSCQYLSKRNRPPCPSPTPTDYSNSCPLTQRCHPNISSSVIFSSRLHSFPASGSFKISQLFTSSSQSYRSFSFNISPSNEHSGLISFRMDWLDLLAVQETLTSLL